MTNKKNSHTVLVVDDDSSLRFLYSTQFKASGYKIIEAENGKEGLDKTLSEHPDIIILDIKMPVMDGFAMLSALRESGDYGKNIPVIMLTNFSASNEEIIKNVAHTGPVAYIVKATSSPSQIEDKIREILKKT